MVEGRRESQKWTLHVSGHRDPVEGIVLLSLSWRLLIKLYFPQTGDVINFWTFVVYNGLGYHQDDGTFTIQLANVSTDHKTTLPSASTILHPVASAVTPVACQKSGTRVNDGLDAPCAGQLLFEDNFDSLNESNWHIEQRFSSQPDHEFGIYLNRPDIVHVSDGHLSVGVVRLGDNYEALNAVQFGSK